MLEGMYTAAAGMAAQQQRLDALSNDIANVDTVGYKRLRVAFRDLVYSPSGPGGRGAGPNPIRDGAGAAAAVIGRGTAGTTLRTTDEPLDIALDGPGFLQVRQANGRVALTRNGSLVADAQGRLTSDGLPLEPPVVIPRGVQEKDVTIRPDGAVLAGGARVGTIRMVTVRAPDRLLPIGENLSLPTANSGAPTAAGATTRLHQGVLEGSDVDLGDAMADMLLAQRSYSLASRAIDMQDQMAQIANGLKK